MALYQAAWSARYAPCELADYTPKQLTSTQTSSLLTLTWASWQAPRSRCELCLRIIELILQRFLHISQFRISGRSSPYDRYPREDFNFHLWQSSARSVAVACCFSFFSTHPVIVCRTFTGFLQNAVILRPTPFPFEPTAFPIFIVCLPRAYGRCRHRVQMSHKERS